MYQQPSVIVSTPRLSPNDSDC